MPRRAPPTAPAGLDRDLHLHLGRLIVQRPPGGRPYLIIEFWCLFCGHRHHHRWRADDGIGGIALYAAHCDGPAASPEGTRYLVALDPVLDRDSQYVLDGFLRDC